MKTKFLKIFFFLAIFLTMPHFALAAPVPVLNFSDIDSGPSAGNTDPAAGGGGSIVTIWGNYLGSSQGTSTITVGNVPVTAIYYWKNADGSQSASPHGGPADLYTYHKMQEIAFAIPAGVSSGATTISVTVGSVTTNALPFTIRSGNIKFIKAGGNNSNAGTWSSPWADYTNFNGTNVTGTAGTNPAGQIVAGDIVYSVGINSTSGLKIGGNNPVLGTATNPVSIIAYPNTSVSISGSDGVLNDSSVVDDYYSSQDSRTSQYVNLSKLKVIANNATCNANNDPVNGIIPTTGNRIVGDEITGTVYSGMGGAIACSAAGSTTGGSACGGGKYYGLYIHDYGYANSYTYSDDSNTWTSPPYTGTNGACFGADQNGHSSVSTADRFQHLFYISNRSSHAIPAYEIAWCNLSNNPILHGIHIYDTQDEGGWTGTFLVHNNAIINQRGGAIDVSYGLAGQTYNNTPLKIYNNLIVYSPASTTGGLPFRLQSAQFAPVTIYNNTISGYSVSPYFEDYSDDLKNNIFVNTWGQGLAYINSVGPPSIHSNNLFYSTGGSAPSLPSFYSTGEGDINSNPLFASDSDFSLQSGSPAASTGSSATLTVAPTDFYGQQRTSGSVSMGAFQYVVSGPDTTAPIISNGLPAGILDYGTTATTLSVTTDENATCKYSATPGTAFASMTTFSTTGATIHSTSISGLANGGNYSYYVKCQDSSNNTDASDYIVNFSVASTPTPLGYAPVNGGGTLDSVDQNVIDATKFTMPNVTGTAASMSVYIGSVIDNSPNNKYQLAIYSDSGSGSTSIPGTLIASSAQGTLTTANGWNTLPISATLQPGITYWLAYNTNSSSDTKNILTFDAGSTGQMSYKPGITFGTWPSPITSMTGNIDNKMAIYVTYNVSSSDSTPPSAPSGLSVQ